MPEFILDHGSEAGTRALAAVDSFTAGYVEAMFFTDTEPGTFRDTEDADTRWNPETHSSLPGDATVADLSPAAWEAIKRDCDAFQEKAAVLLDSAYERDYDSEQAGRDFWFTRNGHGVGFWDREALEPDNLGRQLSDLCGYKTEFKEVSPGFGDDGMIYLD